MQAVLKNSSDAKKLAVVSTSAVRKGRSNLRERLLQKRLQVINRGRGNK